MIKMMKVILTLTIPLLLIAASPATEPKIKIKYLSEPYLLEKLIKPTPTGAKILNQCHYIASFRGTFSSSSGTIQQFSWDLEKAAKIAPKEIFLFDEDRQYFMEPKGNIRLWVIPTSETIWFGPQKIKRKSFEKEPIVSQTDIVDPYGSTRYLRVNDVSVEKVIYEVKLLAATPERAEALAKTAICLYNEYYLAPERQKMIEAIKEEKERQPDLIAQVEKGKKHLEALESQLKQYPEMKVETINALETQKWLISVDIAGVQAKIESIQKLLKLKNNAVTFEKLDENQIVAQIELADFLARQDKIESILTFSQKRNKTQTELLQVQAELIKVDQIQKASEQKIKDLTHNLDSWYYQPFKPIDNTITIQPIKQPASPTQK